MLHSSSYLFPFPWTAVGDEHVVNCLADENTPYLGTFFAEEGVSKATVLDTIAR